MRSLVLLVAAAIALSPAAAIAKKQKKQVKLGPVVTATATGPVATTPATTSDATATCPSGLQAVAGGFSAPFGSSGALVVNESYRSAPGSWHVSGTLVSGTGAATAHAYCRRSTLRVTDVSQTGTLPSGGGQSARIEADCAPRAVAISGGFQMTSGPQPAHLPIPEESIGGGPVRGATPPVGNWQVVAQNSDTGEHTITTHVYCASGIKVPAVGQALGTATVPFLGSLTETSVCPPAGRMKGKGKKGRQSSTPLLSGGAFYSPFTVGTGVLPVHTDSRIVGNGFIDAVVNGGSVPGTMTAQSQAMCF